MRTDIEINSNQLKMKRAGGGLPKSAWGGSQPPPDGGVRSEPKAGSRYDPGREGVLMCIPDLQNLGHLPASMSARQEPEGPPSTLTAREAGRKWGLLRRGPQPGWGGGCQRHRWSSRWSRRTGAGMFPWQQVSGHSCKTNPVPGLLFTAFLE